MLDSDDRPARGQFGAESWKDLEGACYTLAELLRDAANEMLTAAWNTDDVIDNLADESEADELQELLLRALELVSGDQRSRIIELSRSARELMC